MGREPARTPVVTVRALLVASLFLAAVVGVYVFFVRTALGQQLDASSFGAITVIRSPLGSLPNHIRVILLGICGALVVILIVIALAQRRIRDVAVAVAICVVTIALSLALKDVLLSRPYLGNFGYDYNTFPSDHEAISTAALNASYLLLPGRSRRPIALVLLIILGAASGLFQVAAYAHRPSDVMAGALLAGGVSALFLGRGSGIGLRRSWRWGLWSVSAAAAILAAVFFVIWQDSGYTAGQQGTGTLAVALAALATVMASLTVGAELPERSGQAARSGRAARAAESPQ
jgi:membrane-associated phospholipid phosphatase